MNYLNGYALLYVSSVLVASLSQILLKKSANKTYPNKIREYLNPLVIIAYGCFFGASLMSTIGFRGVPLSVGPIFQATGYIWVAVLSYFLLHEKIGMKKILGLAIIVIGVIVSTM